MQDSQQIFKLHSEYQPTGDQPQAIEKLVKGFKEGLHEGEEHPLKPENADQVRVTHQPTAAQDNTIDVQSTTKP